MSRTSVAPARKLEAAPGRQAGGRRRIRSVGLGGLLALSIVAAAVGLVQAGLIARGPAAGPPEAHGALDGMQAAVVKAQFLDHDHADPIPQDSSAAGGPAGYQMPAGMMPGMPADGQSRLLIQLNLSNGAGQAKAVDPVTEFVLRNEQGGSWPTMGDTFGGFSQLNPSNGVAGAVFFDVPTEGATQRQWVLEWKRGGRTTHLAVPLGTAPPAHSH
jgi:hypothetical protein